MSLPALNPPPPVRQPPDLPTPDPTLATELMPAPPPLSFVHPSSSASHHGQRLPILTKTGANRYLPHVDLGTTYTGHGALPLGAGSLELPPAGAGGEAEGGKVKRNTRGAALGPNAKSTAVNRVQRTTRSSLRPSSDSPAPAPTPVAGSSTQPPSAQPSSPAAEPSSNGVGAGGAEDGERPSKRQKVEGAGKGKGKMPEGGIMPKDGEQVPNKDYCETCGGIGEFICCDGCPRSYHFLCLNPPVEVDDIPEDKWFCGVCRYNNLPHPKPTNRFFGTLAQKVEGDSPRIFKLPDPIREYFKNVTTGPGGEYVQQGQARGGRLNKYGAVEERDPYRLKDKLGRPILCYKCKSPAVPASLPEAQRRTRAGASKNTPRPIISCDFCNVHWHYDCLEPPLVHPPANWKKWQCPLHVEQVFPMKRIPAKGVKTVDVKQRNKPNNGIIDVIFPEDDLSAMKVENVVINGKRYRIPEKTIVFDFWDALRGKRPEPAQTEVTESIRTSEAPTDLTPLPDPPPTRSLGLYSGFSSPLSSLSSLSSIPEEEISSDPISEPFSDPVEEGEEEEEDGRLLPPLLDNGVLVKEEDVEMNEEVAAEILLSMSQAPLASTSAPHAGLGISQPAPLTDRTNHADISPPSTPTSSKKAPRSSLKVNGSPSVHVSHPTEEKSGVLSAAREQLRKDVQLAMSSSRPSSPRIVASAPSSPKPSITVKQKEDGSFTLKLPSLKRTLSHQNSVAAAAAAAAKSPSNGEDGAPPLTHEEIDRLQAVQRLLQRKGEAALLKFLES